MNLVTAGILLQASGGQPQSMMPTFIAMGSIFLIFYLLLIRPQQKQQKDHQAMLKSIEKGDRVVTAGGLHGTVTGTTDDVLTLEIANVKGERVRIKVDRGRVDRRAEAAKGGDDS